MDARFRDQGKILWDFLHEFFVKCPSCGCFAVVKATPDEHGSNLYSKKHVLICSICHYVTENPFNWFPGGGCDLWLETNCCGNRLWAYNLDHLNYIESYVGAKTRQRYLNDIGYMNTSMLARLPRWMNDRKNREEILRCIRKLKATLPENYQEKDDLEK